MKKSIGFVFLPIITVAVFLAVWSSLSFPAEETQASAVLEGTVRGPEGLAPADIKVFGLAETDGEVISAACDPQGHFRLEVKGKGPFLVRAEAPGVAPAVVRDIQPGSPLTLELAPGYAWEGSVFFKETGKPAAGAEVWAIPEGKAAFSDPADPKRFQTHTKTDQQGHFRLENLPAAAHAVEIQLPGFLRFFSSHRWVGPGAKKELLTAFLSPGVSFSGTVVDSAGKPVSKARVSVQPNSFSPAIALTWGKGGILWASSDAEGRFELQAPPLDSYVLEAEQEKFAPARMENLKPGNQTSLTGLKLVLLPGCTLKAQLKDEGNKPFQGAVTLSLNCPGGKQPQFHNSVSRTLAAEKIVDGQVVFEHLPACSARVRIEPEGYSEIKRNPVILSPGEPADLGEIVLTTGPCIAGRVTDNDGSPIAGATVSAQGFSLGQVDDKTVKTGKEGTFRLAGLNPDLEYSLKVVHQDFGPFSQSGLKAGGEVLNIRLPRAGVIKGRVLTGQPALPLTDYEVKANAVTQDPTNPLAAFQNNDPSSSVREASGTFTLQGLAPGRYTLQVDASGFLPARVENLDIQEGAETVVPDIILSKGATLTGQVLEKKSRAPVPAASLSLEDAGLFSVASFMRQMSASQETGPEGRFSLSGLAPGKHTLKVQAEHLAPAKISFLIEEGQPPAELIVELGQGGSIEGTVRDSAGRPVAGAMVIGIEGLMPDARTVASTDDMGHYRLERLAPGAYRVMAMPLPADEGEAKPTDLLGKMQMAMADVVEDRTTTVNFPKEQGVRVTGTVRKGRTPLETKMFWIPTTGGKPAADNFVSAASDSTGRYEVQVPAAGTYQVSLMQEMTGQAAPKTNSLEVTIPENSSDLSQDLVIPESALAGRVIRQGDGEPLSGANVVAFRENKEGQISLEGAAGSAPSDAQGQFALEGLSKGTYQIVAGKAGFAPAVLTGIKLGDDSRVEDLTCALPPAYPLTIKVVDDMGSPVEGAIVFGMDNPGMLAAGVGGSTTSGGLFQINQLGEGYHSLVAVARGFAPTWLRDVSLPAPANAEAVVRLQRGGQLKVRVVTTGDTPVAGAVLALATEDGTDLTFLYRLVSMMEGQTLTTSSDGWLTIPSVGSETLLITAGSGERRGQGKGSAKAGESTEVTIRLP